jgi:TPR repeat protein
MRTRLWVVACLLLTAAFSAHAETRVALVIGNGAYEHTDHLPNPVHDATDVAAALGKLGYTVQIVTDARLAGMQEALTRFARAASGADQVLIYYAGHGMEAGGVNYLLPVEARVESESTVPLEAVSLPTVMGVAQGARHLGLVILDACRNNPLAGNLKQPGSPRSAAARGLAAVEATGNLMVAFATRDGRVAADGSGRNSPYTKAILETLLEPGLEVRLFWGRVHDRVMSSTGRAQEPFIYGALGGDALYLNPPAPSAPAPTVQYDPRAGELALWQGVQTVGTAEAYREYLSHYPQGQYSGLAKLQIAALTRAAAGGTGVTRPPVSSGTNGPATQAQTAAQDCYRLDGQAALDACERAVRESPGDVSSRLNLGITLHRLNRMDEAVAAYRQAADQGSAVAQRALGTIYANGLGVPKSETEAAKWYRLAADKGDAQAQNGLGVLYYSGHGVLQDYTEALRWYRLAAGQGDSRAQWNLGIMYELGRGVPQSNTEAVKWYRLAAAQGDQDAQNKLQLLDHTSP